MPTMNAIRQTDCGGHKSSWPDLNATRICVVIASILCTTATLGIDSTLMSSDNMVLHHADHSFSLRCRRCHTCSGPSICELSCILCSQRADRYRAAILPVHGTISASPVLSHLRWGGDCSDGDCGALCLGTPIGARLVHSQSISVARPGNRAYRDRRNSRHVLARIPRQHHASGH